MIYSLLRPAIFALDPERAHRLAIAALKAKPTGKPPEPSGPLAVRVAGIDFPNPLGMAAGFDKDAEVPDALLGMGFGHVEVGSITPLPQPGNPKPRLFRLVEDAAVINRMGFNNGGLEAANARLMRRRRRGIVGVNVGANKETTDRVADYLTGIACMAPVADYLTVNISSPNTPGLRGLQAEGELEALLEAIAADRRASDPPVFLKVAPDLENGDHERIVRTAIDNGIAALIVSNTSISRPPLGSQHAEEMGGLSGAPLRLLALKQLRRFYAVAGDELPLIGVGGIATAEQAWERIRAGASLVQLYSAAVYRGPGVARDITAGLEKLMRRDGFASIAEAVGSE
ncbi:quinone-dependent dihydroorotate dehydrogenase [Aurantiacibacter aquimixticola]|uniref:Dihydroorotate dehydrogenase (quinone) n=1 Tax=Aurantiacibacter aquimixticola TaxID=1958945 RepID=A0A419RX13_9SPHN|nr:quinone-dependent dihydroorotate dehydrogenase [Aurantiacibacter aquimixticola]RJY10317.1 quinone-dependent dihydroorotate dehydrogenase [Aurantiacibacter aquimixticola]